MECWGWSGGHGLWEYGLLFLLLLLVDELVGGVQGQLLVEEVVLHPIALFVWIERVHHQMLLLPHYHLLMTILPFTSSHLNHNLVSVILQRPIPLTEVQPPFHHFQSMLGFLLLGQADERREDTLLLQTVQQLRTEVLFWWNDQFLIILLNQDDVGVGGEDVRGFGVFWAW